MNSIHLKHSFSLVLADTQFLSKNFDLVQMFFALAFYLGLFNPSPNWINLRHVNNLRRKKMLKWLIKNSKIILSNAVNFWESVIKVAKSGLLFGRTNVFKEVLGSTPRKVLFEVIVSDFEIIFFHLKKMKLLRSVMFYLH